VAEVEANIISCFDVVSLNSFDHSNQLAQDQVCSQIVHQIIMLDKLATENGCDGMTLMTNSKEHVESTTIKSP